MNLVLERIQLRRHQRPPIPRRLRRAQRAPDRVPIDPIPPRELLDPNPTNEMLPTKLRPTLHVKHTLLPNSINKTKPGSTDPRTPPPPPSTGVHLQPAEGGEFSTGADSRAPTHLQVTRDL